MINNIQKNKFQNAHRRYNSGNIKMRNVSFGNKVSIPSNSFNKFLEDSAELAVRMGWTILFKIAELINPKQINLAYNKFSNISENSPEYIKEMFKLGKALAKGLDVEINLKSKRISEIAESNESCIFIMNHDNIDKDYAMLSIFNSLLNREYIRAGKTESCPRQKIIISKNIINAFSKKLRPLAEKIGLIGIDASVFKADEMGNARKLIPTLKKFYNDKVHIFIFPEGHLNFFKHLDMKYKFQTGIAEIINKAAKTKERVKVVPLGFSYNNPKNSPVGIHVGKPIYFKKEGQDMLVTKGNINSKLASQEYVNFYKNGMDKDGYKKITSEGKSIDAKDMPDYIAGILCENLKICRKESKRASIKTSSNEKTIAI